MRPDGLISAVSLIRNCWCTQPCKDQRPESKAWFPIPVLSWALPSLALGLRLDHLPGPHAFTCRLEASMCCLCVSGLQAADRGTSQAGGWWEPMPHGKVFTLHICMKIWSTASREGLTCMGDVYEFYVFTDVIWIIGYWCTGVGESCLWNEESPVVPEGWLQVCKHTWMYVCTCILHTYKCVMQLYILLICLFWPQLIQ